MKDKFLSLMGIARKAGKLSVGTEAVLGKINTRKSRLIVIASDAAKNTADKIKNACANAEYEVTILITKYTKNEIGQAVGFYEVSAASVDDKNLAKALEENFKVLNNGGII